MKTTIAGFRFAVRLFLLATPLFFLAGCIKQKILVVVNPDGTGNIVVTRVFSPEAVAMAESSYREMRRHPADFGPAAGAAATNDPFFSEAKLKTEGKLYGRGVELVKGQKIDRHGARGSVAVYRFKDVNQVRIPMAREETFMMMASPEVTEVDEDMQDTFASQMEAGDAVLFSLTKGARNSLKIQMPSRLLEATAEAAERAKAEAGKPPEAHATEPVDAEEEDATDGEFAAMGGRFGMSGRESEADAARQSLKGMRLALDVEVRGNVARSTAGHAAKDRPQRFSLYDLDFDTVMASPRFDAVARENRMTNPSDIQESLGALIGLPGAVLETNKEVVVEFKQAEAAP